MKHASSWLTILLLGAVPLTATALDYGPNRTLLASDASAPQASDIQANATPTAGTAQPDVTNDSASGTPEPSPANPPAMPSTSSPPGPAMPRGRSPSSSSKPDIQPPVKPRAERNPTPWRSLLPGSIQ